MSALEFDLPPRHTSRYTAVSAGDLLDDELVIVADNATENRGRLPVWSAIKKKDSSRLLHVRSFSNENIEVRRGSENLGEISLRDDKALSNIIGSRRMLIDVSGLPHQIWAAWLRAAHVHRIPCRALYAEPESYRQHPTPASSTQFDLSVSFQGMGPLPGFAKLQGPDDDTKCVFVALLGFEGNRPLHLALHLDPTPRVIPVVGVPGFQIEFPAFTVACNRELFKEYSAHSELRLARASCPFEAYMQLEEVARDFPDHYMYVAPVGTKPHAMGAIWYALDNPNSTEILYDFPVRKSGRTKGVGVIHIYDFGAFDERHS